MVLAIKFDDEEIEIIKKHRAAKEKSDLRFNNRIKALDIARKYDIWLRKNGRGSSFSTFVDEFGFEGDDSFFMYQVLKDILAAADKW